MLGRDGKRWCSCKEVCSPRVGSGSTAGQRIAHHRPTRGAEVRAAASASACSTLLCLTTLGIHVQQYIVFCQRLPGEESSEHFVHALGTAAQRLEELASVPATTNEQASLFLPSEIRNHGRLAIPSTPGVLGQSIVFASRMLDQMTSCPRGVYLLVLTGPVHFRSK